MLHWCVRLYATAPPVPRLDPSAVVLSRFVLVDARSEEDFARTRLPQALNLPVAVAMLRFKKGEPLLGGRVQGAILVYCDSQKCEASDRVARLLQLQGYKSVSILEGGLSAWKGQQNGIPSSGSSPRDGVLDGGSP
jgi:rhodanese-related sulfurtransferase